MKSPNNDAKVSKNKAISRRLRIAIKGGAFAPAPRPPPQDASLIPRFSVRDSALSVPNSALPVTGFAAAVPRDWGLSSPPARPPVSHQWAPAHKEVGRASSICVPVRTTIRVRQHGNRPGVWLSGGVNPRQARRAANSPRTPNRTFHRCRHRPKSDFLRRSQVDSSGALRILGKMSRNTRSVGGNDGSQQGQHRKLDVKVSGSILTI